MTTITTIRLRQAGQGRRPLEAINCAHVDSVVTQALQGSYGRSRSRTEVSSIALPYNINYMTVVCETEAEINWATRQRLVGVVAGAVNSAGEGLWSFSDLVSPVTSIRQVPATPGADLSSQTASPGGTIPSSTARPLPPPIHAQAPLRVVRGAISGGKIQSSDSARSGLTVNAADRAAPPDSPGNQIAVGSVLPIVAIVGGIVLVIGAGVLVYHKFA